MHHSLISTALLAQQQANKVTFTMSGGPEDDKSGFWFKGYANEDEDNETMIQVLIYMDEELPTGYGVLVHALDEDVILLDQPITTFKEFQGIFRDEYIQKIYDNQ